MSDSPTPSTVYPVMPMRGSVLFPFQMMPISAGRAASVAALEAAVESEDKTLVIVSQTKPEVDEPKFDDLFVVGTLAVIKRMNRAGDAIQAIVQGSARVRLVRAIEHEVYLKVEVEVLPDPADTNTEIEALYAEVVKLAQRAMELIQPQTNVPLEAFLQDVEKPIQLVYLLGAIFSLGLEKEQALLASSSVEKSLRIVHEYLTHEVQVLELRHKIASQAATEMSKQQREYMLRQQLQAIKKELGEENPEEAEATELRRRMEEADLPENVRKEVEKELSRLERMSPAAPDFQIARTYIDLALELPWNKTTDDVLDLPRARQVLDEDHYDLRDVKDRIIEHLAVMKMNPQAKAPILCFVGPPGVGKTSLGQSIARAMGRMFERMSLGGLHDEAELRGHRRTYIGAMPGRIIQAIRRAGVRNPLLMLDEVDKLGRDFRGDPASALMEILDPAQNREFHDNYLDLPFDLSKVFFITTANTLDNIPRPLLDRMEVLRLSGYTEPEKIEIAKRFLVKKQRSAAGLSDKHLQFTDEGLSAIIQSYTREAGVRNLEREIANICRKVARKVVKEGQNIEVGITKENVSDYLGVIKFRDTEAEKQNEVGLAIGLAWTEVGGQILVTEATLMDGKGRLTLTGKLGDVMQESAQAAMSYLRSRSHLLGLQREFYRRVDIHIHVPEGAIPKDGPSAGITLATTLASALARIPVRRDVAMTGEITLRGKVLPIGGLKEKLLAAQRAGIHEVILPKDNQKDMADIPAHIQQDFKIHFVETMDQVLQIALERPPVPLDEHAADAPIRAEFPSDDLSDQESLTH